MDEIYLYSKSLKPILNDKIDELDQNLFGLKRNICRLYIKWVFNLKDQLLQETINQNRDKIKNYHKKKEKYLYDRYILEKILFLFRRIPF